MDSQKVKEIRKKLGVSQTEFAEMLGVSTDTILNYEKGKVIPKSKIPLLQDIENQIEAGNIEQINIKTNGTNINRLSNNDKLENARLHKILEEKDKQINKLLEIINKFNIA